MKRTLIIGWNVEAVNLFYRLLSTPALGYDVQAFLNPADSDEDHYYNNIHVIAGISNLERTIRRFKIDELLIVLSPSEKHFLPVILKLCSEYQLNYTIVADAYGVDDNEAIRQIISNEVKVKAFSLRRIADLAAATFLLILLAPIMLVVAIAIRMESPGPIIYSQKRYGINGTTFFVHKFRSMVQDAEKKSGPVWASKRDPRITRMGSFMRKTRIDELPQLFNIIKGEMSFIGPRPERPFFADAFKKQIPFYMNRLKARPGITGLAQVTVGYDETIEDVREKVLRDIEYIDRMSSLRMNLYVLWKTVGTVLLGQGQ